MALVIERDSQKIATTLDNRSIKLPTTGPLDFSASTTITTRLTVEQMVRRSTETLVEGESPRMREHCFRIGSDIRRPSPTNHSLLEFEAVSSE